MVYNTLFPLRKVVGDFIWNSHKAFFMKSRRNLTRRQMQEEDQKQSDADKRVLTSLFGASGFSGGSRRILSRISFTSTSGGNNSALELQEAAAML